MGDFLSAVPDMHPGRVVLAIETSCDETAVAILDGCGELAASIVASQAEVHGRYGGVVPEVASRSHLTQLRPCIDAAIAESGVALRDVDIFAATAGPGLATSLMIGTSVARGLALSFGKPYLGMNHLEGHLLSPFFGRVGGVEPSMALVVSGGHTMLVDIRGVGDYALVGQTRDDAAGEAFDKVAKLLGLPYPGGPHVNRISENGRRDRFDFPRSMLHSGDFAFSFSGLKTAVRYLLPEISGPDLADVCASFQEAIVDVLVKKTVAAAKQHGRKKVAVSGGVSCNSRLRTVFQSACAAAGMELLLARAELCTDNAGMIAYAAQERARAGISDAWCQDIDPNLKLCAAG